MAIDVGSDLYDLFEDILWSDLPVLDDVPDIIEFVLSPHYLNRPNLYPRQGTILKILFLQEHLFTEYDYKVIEEWTRDFVLPPPERRGEEVRYEGDHGIPPDILERIHYLRGQGRKWFREALTAIGRRGGKGYIGAIAVAYVIWHYYCLGNPQAFYGVDLDKRLGMYVFAGKREQARANQWRDIVNVILGAPCFTRIISRSQGEILSLRSRADVMKQRQQEGRGISTTLDVATFEIVPKESTPMAGRGPALFCLAFDEMAHVVATSSNASAEAVWESATPALDQFGHDAFIYCGSSTWQMMGQFYVECQQALEVEMIDGEWRAVYPDKIIIQLTSWDPYEDWEQSHEIPLVPDGYALAQSEGMVDPTTGEILDDDVAREPNDFYIDASGGTRCFGRIKRAIQVYDENMARLERANPETFAVERRSKWAASLNSYLNPVFVDRIFEKWRGQPLSMQARGSLKTTYIAHGDPSKSGANFGWAIAHTEGPDENGMMHVVFDVIHCWRPTDYEDGTIDYIAVTEDINDYLDRFIPSEVSFDQFNSAPLMAQIKRHVAQKQYPKRVDVFERTATASQNWAMAECFKTAMGMNLIHAPLYEQAELELRFLQVHNGKRVDHPTTGPVQTKDVFDAMANIVWGLIGEQMSAYIKEALTATALSASGQSGLGDLNMPNPAADNEVMEALSSLGRARGVHQMPPNSMPGRGSHGGFRR